MKKEIINLIIVFIIILIVGGILIFNAQSQTTSFISIPKAYASSILSGGTT